VGPGPRAALRTCRLGPPRARERRVLDIQVERRPYSGMEIVKDDGGTPLSDTRAEAAAPPPGRWARMLLSWERLTGQQPAADRDPCVWMHREVRT
jgi:hypothetical protein